MENFKSKKLENIKEIIYPELKTNFQLFEIEILESIYKSHKNKPLGKGRSTPKVLTHPNQVFGRKNLKSPTVYEVILPKNNDVYMGNILAEPSERINRRYHPASFNPDEVFGIRTWTDSTGRQVKCCMTDIDYPSHVCILNAAQEKSNNKATRGHRTIPCLEDGNATKFKNQTFGIKSVQDKYTVKELLYNKIPNDDYESLRQAISYLALIRFQYGCSAQNNNFKDILAVCRECDKNENGKLHLDSVFNILQAFSVDLCKAKIKQILTHNKIMDSCDSVDYESFLKLINCQTILPSLEAGSSVDLAIDADSATSTHTGNDSMEKFNKINNERIDRDGAVKCSKSSPNKTKMTKGLPDDYPISARALISPSVPTLFGLSYHDYLLPRPKEQIREIFSKFCAEAKDPNQFEQIYSECLQVWPNEINLISVEVFRYVLNMHRIRTEYK